MGESTVITNKCPNCGGPLLFNPKDQKFHCEYCGSTFTENEVNQIAEKQADAGIKDPLGQTTTDVQASDEKNVETQTETSQDVGLFLCPSCGAEIVTDANTASTFCFYCHNPVLLSSRLSGQFLPEKVLPFQIERKEAENEFLEWVGKKKFVPKAFFNKKQIENLSGVYFPYWVVDADLTGQLTARGRNVRVWIQGDTEFTETSEFQVTRVGDSSFKDLVKKALRKNLSDHLVGAVEPFDMRQAVDFKNQYLSGFLTEKRDIEFSEMKADVEKEFQQYATSLMQSTINGYTAVTNVRGEQNLTHINQDYVLLPIWLVTYKQKTDGKMYYYAMNGQTGKVAGVLPIDAVKLFWVSALIFIVLLILGVIVGYYIS